MGINLHLLERAKVCLEVSKPFLWMQIRLVSAWVLIGLVQVVSLFMHFEKFTFSVILTPWGIAIGGMFFVFFTELFLLLAYISAFVFWVGARALNGQGSLINTCTDFLWGIVSISIPFGICSILLQSDWFTTYAIKQIFRIGMWASIIFGGIIIIKGFSKTHAFNLLRSFLTFVAGAAILSLVGALTIFVIKTYGEFSSVLRTLFVFFISMTVVLLIGLTLMKIVYKTKKIEL